MRATRDRRNTWTGVLASGVLMLLAALPGEEAVAQGGAAITAKDHTCVEPAVIACGSTVTATLTDHDCFLPDFYPDLEIEAFFDGWLFEGTAGSTVTINLTSDEFDTALGLVDQEFNPVDVDDDGGGGTNARIVHQLTASGPWGIVAAGLDAEELGDYTLSLECTEPAGLYFLDGRFQVSVDWRLPSGQSGVGQAIPITDKSGLFYFFDPANLEMLIKMLDACSLNQRFWVFYAATTNVEFTVRVLDTESGQTKTYDNPPNHAALPVQDTSAFATCP